MLECEKFVIEGGCGVVVGVEYCFDWGWEESEDKEKRE